jgi:hypothetical protein
MYALCSKIVVKFDLANDNNFRMEGVSLNVCLIKEAVTSYKLPH